MKKTLAVLILSSIAGLANAMPTTSDIPLPISGNGVVSPNGGTFAVSLEPLLANVLYRVECTITNQSKGTVGMVFNYTYSQGIMSNGPFSLNGTPLQTGQGLLISGSNDLMSGAVAFPVQSNLNTVTFKNTDNTTSVTVSNCIAHFVSGKH